MWSRHNMPEPPGHDPQEFQPRPFDSDEIGMEPAHGADSPRIQESFDSKQSIASEPALTGRLCPLSDVREDPLHATGDEMALHGIATAPAARRGFAEIYTERRIATTNAQRWGLMVALALIGGPLAILTCVFSVTVVGFGTLVSVVYICVFGPLTEEMLKIAGVLYLAEKKPWLIPNRAGPVLVGLGAGFGFAAVENLMYISVYFPEAGPEFATWRWTVCVGLHVACSVLASLGVSRVWMVSHTRGTLPSLALASPFLATAVILHGGYNTLAVILELSGVLPF